MTFEVGGRNKGKKQIAGVNDAFVMNDDIEYGYENVIPLWHFGESHPNLSTNLMESQCFVLTRKKCKLFM